MQGGAQNLMTPPPAARLDSVCIGANDLCSSLGMPYPGTASRGQWSHWCTALYNSLVIIHRKSTGAHENGLTPWLGTARYTDEHHAVLMRAVDRAVSVATGRKVINAPPCIFSYWFFIENIQGCAIMILLPLTRWRRRPHTASPAGTSTWASRRGTSPSRRTRSPTARAGSRSVRTSPPSRF
jgi:hypothetical protein